MRSVLALLFTSALVTVVLNAQQRIAPQGGNGRPGPAQQKFDEAFTILKEIGPGAAASLKTYRYQVEPADGSSDLQAAVAVRRLKEGLDGPALEAATRQILADLIDINTKGSGAGASPEDRNRKSRAGEALKQFIALGEGHAQGTFTAWQQSGFAGETNKNSARGILSDEIMQAVSTLGSNARNEEYGALLEAVKAGIHAPPVKAPVFENSETAAQRYETVVKILRESVGPGAAAALETMRWAREPVDTFRDRNGNVLYEGDKQFVLSAKAPMEMPNDPTSKGPHLPAEVPTDLTKLNMAGITPLMMVFAQEAGMDLTDINSNYNAGTKDYDRVRWSNALEAMNALIRAGGDDEAIVKNMDARFGKMGRGANADQEFINNVPVGFQIMRSANALVNAVIIEEEKAAQPLLSELQRP